MPEGGYATPYHDLLAELRRLELAVLEQRNRVNRFELDMISSANLSPEREAPKKRSPNGNQYRNGNQFVPGFVIDALNALPIEHHQLNGKVKLTEP